MGQFEEGLTKLKVAAALFALACIGLFWALVAGLLVLNGVVNDGLLRLQALRLIVELTPPTLHPSLKSRATMAVIKKRSAPML